MEAFKALLKQITSFWAGKDKRFKRNAIIIAVAALAVVIVVSVILNQVPYATLYSGLSSEDSAAVMTALDSQKETYKVSGDAIQVPSKDVDKLRLSLSAQVKNSFNLDILKQGEGLGMTEADKADYRKAQLEYDIQNSIKTVTGVSDARVLLTLPESSGLVISSANQDATASLLLTLDPGVELTSAQVKAIKEFVLKAVQGLKMENISAMDSDMQSLDDGGSSDDFGSANDQYALQNEVEAKLRQQVMALLLPVFGMGHVETQVNAVLNFDDNTTDSLTYKPVVNDKDGVISSYDKLKEQIVNGADSSGQPGVSSNTGTDTYPATATGSNGTYEKTEDKVNLEVDTIQQHITEAKGKIQQLSVSVVIDNTNLKTDLTDNVKSLVKNAVGADIGSISVEYVPMQGAQASVQASTNGANQIAQSQKTSQNMLYYIIGGVVLALFAVILLASLYSKSRKTAAEPDRRSSVITENMSAEEIERQEMENELAAIKIVKDSSAKEQISKLIEKNPELVANLLRSWLADEQE
jgi:flagellar M-ring protein FliF